jgi:hypothetical protein
VEFNVKSPERLWIVAIAGIVGLVVLVVAAYLIWQSFQVDEVKPKEAQKPELPRMANLPPKKEAIPPPPPPSYTPDAPVLEKARNGNAEAALAVARYYDPTDKAPSGTIRKNPETAYGWYTEALAGGQENAKTRLAQLRSWVEEQANQGSYEARELLHTWR